MHQLIFRQFDTLQDYQTTFQKMKAFTAARDVDTPDEIWFLEHLPVYTQGQAGKQEHILNPGNIPIIQSDRGGQVTYHGPGQLMIYTLLNLKRHDLNIRQCVTLLEEIIIACLEDFQINSYAKPEAPGIYISEKKIASIGLRVKRGCTYHGISFNINMDLSPFEGINPCGYQGLTMTQFSEYEPTISTSALIPKIKKVLSEKLKYPQGEPV